MDKQELDQLYSTMYPAAAMLELVKEKLDQAVYDYVSSLKDTIYDAASELKYSVLLDIPEYFQKEQIVLFCDIMKDLGYTVVPRETIIRFVEVSWEEEEDQK